MKDKKILRITHNALKYVVLLSMSLLYLGCTTEEVETSDSVAAADSSLSTYQEEYWEW